MNTPLTHKYFTPEQVIEIVKGFNRCIFESKLDLSPTKIPAGVQFIELKNFDKNVILRELRRRFDKICGESENHLTRQSLMNQIVDKMLTQTGGRSGGGKVEGPRKATEWLGTEHIENVMKKYEKIYLDFHFVGAVPLDCDKLPFCELSDIKYDKLSREGINKIGVVFNHDVYGDPGSHWVAMYIDLEEGEIDFCDSTGKGPIDHINDVIKNFQTYYKQKNGKNPIYKENKNKYQRDKSECGVYSCNFLIRRLAGESFEEVTTNFLDFKDINSCRNAYFSNRPSKYEPHELCDPPPKN